MITAPPIPSITDEFYSTEDIGWYGSAYMLTAAIFFPLCGLIYQLYSRHLRCPVHCFPSRRGSDTKNRHGADPRGLNRSVGGSMLFVFLLSGGMMAIIYYLTIWFQAAHGQSAIQAGIHSNPIVLCLFIIGTVAAIFVQKVRYYIPPLLISPVLCAVGVGCGFQTSNLVPQNMLAHVDIPLGMALMFFMQQLGISVFLPLGQKVFASQLSSSVVFPALRTSTLRLPLTQARPHSETRCGRHRCLQLRFD